MKNLGAIVTVGVLAVGVLLLLVGRANDTAANSKTAVEQPGVSAQSAPPHKPADRWEVKTTADIAGTKHVTLEIDNVVVRCAPKLEMYVIPEANHIIDYNEDHEQSVRYKLGDEKGVHASTWAVSDDATALFLPTGVALSAIKADKLTLEYREYERTASTETFDLAGLNEAFHNAGCPAARSVTATSHGTDHSPGYTLPDGRKVTTGLLHQ